jgi:CRP-like cAMP-binding protein
VFGGLNESTLTRLVYASTCRTYKRGSHLPSPRDGEKVALIVVQGRIEAIATAADGRKLSVYQVLPGEMLDCGAREQDIDGEVAMVLVAIDPMTTVCSIPWALFAQAVSPDGDGVATEIEHVCRQRDESAWLAAELALCDVEVRVHCLLHRLAARHPQKEVPFTLKELARMAGTSVGRVSRVISDLRRKGIVTRYNRGLLVIHDPGGLLSLRQGESQGRHE